VPDPLVYSEWFGRTDERRRAVAVGAGRYAEMLRALDGQAATWEHFLDPETGDLVPRDRLRAESPTARAERTAKVRALIAERRRLLRQAAVTGWVG
jgi:hypothetical protein